jgi:hypothetical protein
MSPTGQTPAMSCVSIRAFASGVTVRMTDYNEWSKRQLRNAINDALKWRRQPLMEEHEFDAWFRLQVPYYKNRRRYLLDQRLWAALPASFWGELLFLESIVGTEKTEEQFKAMLDVAFPKRVTKSKDWRGWWWKAQGRKAHG